MISKPIYIHCRYVRHDLSLQVKAGMINNIISSWRRRIEFMIQAVGFKTFMYSAAYGGALALARHLYCDA